MTLPWSDVQNRRLVELDAPSEELKRRFTGPDARNQAFQSLETQLIKRARMQLRHYRDDVRRPALCRLQTELVQALTKAGFVQVHTPTIMSRGLLAKMTIDSKHPLYSQVFWLDNDRCLRPMLAPHLYYILKDLLRLWEKPVRIFEVGSCFRKESQGAKHAAEFTMLNLVEMGLPLSQRSQRLHEMAGLVMEQADLNDYRLQTQSSSVYGETIDVEAGKEHIEVGSGAVGPHSLDHPWHITEPWVGIGFGLERILMVRENSSNLARMGRSLTYLDGIRLNV